MADSGLHKDFEPRLKSLQEILRTQYGIDTTIDSAGRSMAEQARLYSQGRTAPGPIVTNAPPGSSYHNFGAAVDLRPAGGASEAQLERALRDVFSTQAAKGLAPGLTWGGTFKKLYDPLHVQLGVSLADLRSGAPLQMNSSGPTVAAAGTGSTAAQGSFPRAASPLSGGPGLAGLGTGAAGESGLAVPSPPPALPQVPLPELGPSQVQMLGLLQRYGRIG